MANDSATFNVNLAGNTKEASEANTRGLQSMRAAIDQSRVAFRQLADMQGLLKGKDQETLDARSKLKAAMDRERAAMNANAVAMVKLGGNYGQLKAQATSAAKASADAAKQNSAVGNGLKLVGGPLDEARTKIIALQEAFEGANAAAVLAAGAIALVVAAVAVLAAGVVAGAVAFSKWVLGSADVARSLQLVREGAVNSGKEAKNLGGIVDQLAKRSPMAKEEINALGVELYRTFNNTSANAKTGGQIIADTLDLVTTATSAASAQVGNQLKGIVERGKMMQRLQLGRQDLFGSGVKVEDVAGALSKNLKIGLKDAQQALLEGRVTLSDGVKALNEAVQKRFGEINARKMLSADVIFKKFHETLTGFAAGVNLEPLANAAAKFFSLFNDNNAVGASLKRITEVLGNDLVATFVKLEPIAEETFLRVLNAVLKVIISGYEMKNAFERTFGKGSALALAKEPLREIGNAADLIATSFQIAAAAANQLASLNYKLPPGLTAKDLDAPGGGFKGNTRSGPGFGGATTVAPANADGGLVKPAPGEAFASVAPGEHIVPAGASVGGRGSSGGLVVNLGGISIAGGGQAEKLKSVVSSPNFLAEVTHAIEHILQAAGVPVQTVPG